MYIFTPNTLIKSSEINTNFAQVTTLENPPFAYGSVASNIVEGVKTLYPVASSGITFSNSNLYTIVTKGLYFINAQQLISTNVGSATYFRIDINGSPIKYAYINASTAVHDAVVTCLKELNVGDTFRIYQQGAIASAWEAQHSSYQLFLIKRT